MDTVVVSICTFHSGTMANVFAETAELSGTVRTFNPKLQKELPGMIERIIKSTCRATGLNMSLTIILISRQRSMTSTAAGLRRSPSGKSWATRDW